MSDELVHDGICEEIRNLGASVWDSNKYDYERCNELREKDGRFHYGYCEGLEDIRCNICKKCGYYKDNVAHESPKLEVGTNPKSPLCPDTTSTITDRLWAGEPEKQTMGSLENEIFTKIYTGNICNLNEGIDMLKGVIRRLENVKKQNAEEALKAFLYSYCEEGKCSKCAFSFGNYNCSAKVQLANMERDEE